MVTAQELDFARKILIGIRAEYDEIPSARKYFIKALATGGAAACYLTARKFLGEEFMTGFEGTVDILSLWTGMYSIYSLGKGAVKSAPKLESGIRLKMARKTLDNLTKQYAESERMNNLDYVSRIKRKSR